jgi:uncharacterized protein (TIGR03790 family)
MNRRAAVFCAALAVLPGLAAAQTGENVLLVVNSGSQASIQISARYAKARSLPERNIVRLESTDTDTISRGTFESTIERPIAAWLTRHRLQDQILYIVLTKGVPLRIAGTAGLTGSSASVDSELTLLYRKMVGLPTPVVGRVENPYFAGDESGRALRLARENSDLYLVTRLDGFSIDDVLKLIERSRAPGQDGVVVLDQRAMGSDRGGDSWLAETAERLTTMGWGGRVRLETTRALASDKAPVVAYFSWGSSDPANRRRQTGLQFVSGAIGGMFVGTDARTFREPAVSWRPSATTGRGGEALAGDLIREGITGLSGHVAEPLLDAIVRPQIAVPAYLSGFNLAEAFYLAMPFLSWQNIVIGDPLCSPFQTRERPVSPVDEGLDPETELPRHFARRRIEALSRSGLSAEAVKLFIKSQNLSILGRPQTEVSGLLIRATELEPRLVEAHLLLATAAYDAGDIDESISRYQAVLESEPNNIVALNNLAYALAEHRNRAKDALPLAERAYRLSSQSGAVADTLGWVHYKLGSLSEALNYAERAVRLEPDNGDILVHAAAVHVSLKSLAQAGKYLEQAMKLDARLAERADVKALLAQIR